MQRGLGLSSLKGGGQDGSEGVLKGSQAGPGEG